MKTTHRIKVFVDTNVLLDYLIPSRNFHRQAVDLFILILTTQIEASFSTQSMLDVVYIGCKYNDFPQESLRNTLAELLVRTNSGAIDPFDLKSALLDVDSDIEDSAQIAFAYNQCCDVIVTNDRKMLGRKVPAPMTIMTPEDFVGRCRSTGR